MKVVKPTLITAAMLVSTTATETHAAWNPVTAYATGDRVILTSTQRVYTRLIAGTTATSPELDAVNWFDTSPTNKWAMLDREVSTVTSATSSLTVVLKPGYVNSLSLYGLTGQSLTVTVRDALAGAVVYGPEVVNLDGTVIGDWYQYFFDPYVQLESVVLTDLPPYADAHITSTLAGSGTVACGIVDVGTFYNLGDTEFGAALEVTDYSRKITDDFGVTTFVKRGNATRLNARMMFDNVQLNKITSILRAVSGMPCSWIGTHLAGYEPLNIFGWSEGINVEVPYPTKSYCSLTVQGLTS